MGKLNYKEISEIVKCIKPSSKVLIPPLPGCDAGVYEVDSNYYGVISTDPCAGVPQEWFGWFLVNYASSDVALFGAQPKLAAINLLGPEGIDYKIYKRIMSQACKATKELKMDIISGHTGNYPAISQLVGICTVEGFVKKDKLITPMASKPGDLMLLVKPLGLETLTNFAIINHKKSNTIFGFKNARNLRSMVRHQSCVNEALLLAECQGVNAMHDIAEGGLIVALNEMANLSHNGFEVIYDELIMKEEIKGFRDSFNLNLTELLSISSSGCLIVSISPDKKEEIVKTLTKKGIINRIIGKFNQEKKRLLVLGNRKFEFPTSAKDPYTKIFYS
ncbi:AIR synthase-related protein [[Eubacterium] cellulosolvens]